MFDVWLLSFPPLISPSLIVSILFVRVSSPRRRRRRSPRRRGRPTTRRMETPKRCVRVRLYTYLTNRSRGFLSLLSASSAQILMCRFVWETPSSRKPQIAQTRNAATAPISYCLSRPLANNHTIPTHPFTRRNSPSSNCLKNAHYMSIDKILAARRAHETG